MPLKIIGAGFGRTGTMSTYTALTEIGFPCYHMFEVRKPKNAGHVEFWQKVASAPEGTQFNWEEVFADYTAAVDNPACCVWRELMVAYPDAKVLLNVHPKGPDAWYESTMETIYAPQRMWEPKLLAAFIPSMRKFNDMVKRLIWDRAHKGTMENRASAIAFYNAHIEAVKAAVPPEKLLIFSAAEGWEPLCKFLNVPVPQTPFPRVNDREEFKRMFIGMRRGAYGLVAVLALLGAGAIWAASALLG